MNETHQDSDNLLSLAEGILLEASKLVQTLRSQDITSPSLLKVGASSELWNEPSHASPSIEEPRAAILGLSGKLRRLLLGPRAFLTEYVAINWEHGALYALLELGVFDKIPLDGGASLRMLSHETGMDEKRLLPLLRLASCEEIVQEVAPGVFGHTAISEALMQDEGFRSFIGFQLFETRVASANLADCLKTPKPFWKEEFSAFTHAWEDTMCDWHKSHLEKGSRFGKAMETVARSIDPGNALLKNWFTKHAARPGRKLVIDISGKTGQTAKFLASEFSGLTFEVRDSSATLLDRGKAEMPSGLAGRISFREHKLFDSQGIPTELTRADEPVLAYLISHVLWSLSDDDCTKFVQSSLIPALEASPGAALLINELLSPPSKGGTGSDGLHREQQFRRRDVTVMIMHNAKMRTEEDWREIFARASPLIEVYVTSAVTSHSCRGLWEIRLGCER